MYNMRFFNLLAEKYPNIQQASTEIINLRAILNLPKGTEHFISDIHGEYEHFLHMLKNASGVIKAKIAEVYGDALSLSERRQLEILICYPEEKMSLIEKDPEWYKLTLRRMIEVCKVVGSKYTRSKVRKALPKDFEYVIDELLHGDFKEPDKLNYYNGIIETIIDLDRADAFIIALANLIQRLAIDHLHIVGDIFDRGPRPDIILDKLINYHSVDVQWGNHDIVWMGAGCGSEACIAIVIANCLKYNNIDVLEDGYGINLRKLEAFANDVYKDDDCKVFQPRGEKDNNIARMHKAISIIRFKIEGQIKLKYKDFNMHHKLYLDELDLKNGKTGGYTLTDTNFPTVDSENPFKLTEDEEYVINNLKHYFLISEKLQRHLEFLYHKGSLYTTYNSNLMFHGCIPLDEDGSFTQVELFGKTYFGKEYFDFCDKQVRKAYLSKGESKKRALDFIWYLWCGPQSPLFGKDVMASFERFFIVENEPHKETKMPYFILQEREDICIKILIEFGLDPGKSHIINGHVPIKFIEGESPIKANGKLIVIDGGMCKAYRNQTGIAGYTLIHNSHGLVLTTHQPFSSVDDVINHDEEMVSTRQFVETLQKRKLVKDTDIGKQLENNIRDLEKLLELYKTGVLKEKL